MITCVSLNPSIDRTLEIDKMQVGGLNRVRRQTDAAAGKGVNVALALAALGEETECVGFLQADGGELFRRRLRDGGVTWDFVESPGAVRVNMKVFDREKGQITELNGMGVPASQEQLKQARARIAAHAETAELLILSGSLPPQCPAEFYRTLAEDARCRVILDADGERLRLGLQAKPYLIKPNLAELEALTGRELRSLEDAVRAAKDCVAAGARMTAVSLGADGSVLTDGSETWRAKGVKVEVKSTVAAGDSMIAGFAAAFRRGMGMADALRLAAAAATVRCATPPEEIISGAACLEMAQKIEVERIG